MKLSSVQIITDKRLAYKQIVKDLRALRRDMNATTVLKHSSSTEIRLYPVHRWNTVQATLIAVMEKELEEAKSELMLLGVTEFDE